MAILKGSMTYQKFMVKNSDSFNIEDIIEKLNLFKFRPLHDMGEDKTSLGFSPYLSEYDTQKEITAKDCVFDTNVVISVRIDTINLPKDLLKSLVKKSVEEYYREHQKYPGKALKKEIELEEARGLRKRVLPKTKIVEALWRLKDDELLVFSRSSSLLDQFLDLFQNAFLIRPNRLDFQSHAVYLAEKFDEALRLDDLKHEPIFESTITHVQ